MIVNPSLLNKNDWEIKDCIDEKKKTMSLENIIDELDNNPMLIDEI